MTRRDILGNDRLEILKLAAEGHSSTAIAFAYPYGVAQIRNLIVTKGRSSGGAKIGHELAAQIRQRHAAGESCMAIARSLQIHRNSVHLVLAGKTWKA